MPQQPLYQIAPFSLGEARLYLAENLDMGSAWSLMPTASGAPDAEEGAALPIQLQPNPATSGWTVRTPRGGLALIDAEARAEYPDLNRVTRSGYTATTVGVLRTAEAGLLELEVLLPLPAFAVPRNNLPAEALLLPQGLNYLVDTASGEGLGELADAQPAQVLLTLTLLGEAVIAAYGERVLGQVLADDALLGLLRSTSQVFAARAFVAEDMVVLDADPGQAAGASSLPVLRVPAPAPLQHIEEEPAGDMMIAPELEEAPQGSRPMRGPAQD